MTRVRLSITITGLSSLLVHRFDPSALESRLG